MTDAQNPTQARLVCLRGSLSLVRYAVGAGTDALPTVGGDAHAYTCTMEFMNMQAAWDYYVQNRSYYTYGLYLLAVGEFYTCHITTGG